MLLGSGEGNVCSCSSVWWIRKYSQFSWGIVRLLWFQLLKSEIHQSSVTSILLIVKYGELIFDWIFLDPKTLLPKMIASNLGKGYTDAIDWMRKKNMQSSYSDWRRWFSHTPATGSTIKRFSERWAHSCVGTRNVKKAELKWGRDGGAFWREVQVHRSLGKEKQDAFWDGDIRQ